MAYDPQKLIETSSPVDVPLPLLKKTEKEMQLAKRKLGIKGRAAQKRKARLERSKNYQKQKRKVMDLYLKQKFQKENYLEQLSGKLIRYYDYLFVEAVPNETFLSDFSLQDWYKLVTKLRYKANWYNKTLILINMNEQTDPLVIKKSLELEKIGKQVVFE